MIRLIYILLFLTSFAKAQSVQGNFDTDNISFFEKRNNSRLSDRNISNANSNNFDVTYYHCVWEVDPAIRYIKGSVTFYFKMLQNGQSISVDLMNDLTTDSVKQGSSLLQFSHVNNELSITLNSIVDKGSLDSLTVYYQGIPANSGFGSFILSTHANVSVMWTLSEPYGSRDWWPCKNGLDDKADSIDVYIIHPSEYKAASNGLLQTEMLVESGLKTITHWKHLYPIASYLVCMAVTNYLSLSDTIDIDGNLLSMLTYCYPESQTSFADGIQNTQDAMRLFSSAICPYPFIKEKYGHVQFGWGGGMEHQTSTFLVNTDEVLIAHELAHQWFGDQITCSSWHDIWLNEGFATFFSRFYMEKKYPDNAINARRQVLEDIVVEPGGSVWVADTSNVDRVFDSRLSYKKGSFLLEMLRLKLGDSLFFKGLKNYQADTLLKYKYASTKDLQRNLEAVSGISLNHFFDQWFKGEGFPTYHLQWSMLGNRHVKIKINQQTSDPSVDFFEMLIPIKCMNSTQEKVIFLNNTLNQEIFIEGIGFAPDTIIIDPEYRIISKNNSAEKIIFSDDRDPIVEINPNPTEYNFIVYLNGFVSPTATLRVFNSIGQLMEEKTVALINGAEWVQFNCTNWPKGLYFVKVISGAAHVSKRVLKI